MLSLSRCERACLRTVSVGPRSERASAAYTILLLCCLLQNFLRIAEETKRSNLETARENLSIGEEVPMLLVRCFTHCHSMTSCQCMFPLWFEVVSCTPLHVQFLLLTTTVGYLSFGPIDKIFMFSLALACARRTGAAARVERRQRER